MIKSKKRIRMIILTIVCTIITLGVLSANKKELSQEYIEEVASKAMSKYDIPAVSVRVMKNDGVLYKTTMGLNTKDGGVKVSEQSYFHIGSCSKTLLAIIAGKLVDDKIIDWDTKLFDVIPKLRDTALDEYKYLTLETLLLCKGGIAPFTSGKEMTIFDEQGIKTTREFVEYILTQEPTAKSNDKGITYSYLYSNASYVIVSYMLEEVTAKSYREMVEDLLVDDLGLSVHFGWPNTLDELQPWGHGNFTGNPESFGPDHPYKLHPIIEPSGNVSMKSDDFGKLVLKCLNGLNGNDDYLKTETYSRIFFGNQGWSLGAYNESLFGYTYAGMDGTAGTFYCRGLMIPESDLGIVIMINNGSEQAIEWITMQIAKAYYKWWWMIW